MVKYNDRRDTDAGYRAQVAMRQLQILAWLVGNSKGTKEERLAFFDTEREKSLKEHEEKQGQVDGCPDGEDCATVHAFEEVRADFERYLDTPEAAFDGVEMQRQQGIAELEASTKRLNEENLR